MSDAGAGDSVERILSRPFGVVRFMQWMLFYRGLLFGVLLTTCNSYPSLLSPLSFNDMIGPDRQCHKQMMRFEKPLIDETAPRSEFAHHNPILSQLRCNNLSEAPNMFRIL
jgi:hypothetical protein